MPEYQVRFALKTLGSNNSRYTLMNWKRVLGLLVIILIGSLVAWMFLRTKYPSGEVNYLNYLLLKRGSSLEEVERVIGPFDDSRIIDINTGQAIVRPGKSTGVVKCIWFDKNGIFGNTKIYITFVDGVAKEFEYYSAMP
jgi:hypothetical protein